MFLTSTANYREIPHANISPVWISKPLEQRQLREGPLDPSFSYLSSLGLSLDLLVSILDPKRTTFAGCFNRVPSDELLRSDSSL